MKKIEFLVCHTYTEMNGEVAETFTKQTCICTEEELSTNIEIVKKIAYNGKYTIEEDGQPEPTAEPTQLDQIEAQVTYTAMMTDTLLEV